MHIEHIRDRRYAQFERLRNAAGLVHAFSTRPRDLSPRPGARDAECAARRAEMARDLGLAADGVSCCLQEHDTRIAFVEAGEGGGIQRGYDAIATSQPNKPLMTFSADCPLVLVHDPARGVVGLAHASWRCTVASLTQRLVEAVCERYGCRPASMLAGVGPGAGPCCYEVQRDVYEAAANLDDRGALFPQRDGRLYFDLWQANRAQLIAAGLRPEAIEVAGICTMCRPDLFFSFRREGAGCGHFGLMAAVVER